jgi:hypothetical protein
MLQPDENQGTNAHCGSRNSDQDGRTPDSERESTEPVQASPCAEKQQRGERVWEIEDQLSIPAGWRIGRTPEETEFLNDLG